MQFLVAPLLNLILLFYAIFGNLGLAIIGITVFINLLLFPFTQKSLKMARKQQELKGELDELKNKYGDDRQKLLEQQAALFKKHNINPAAGCLPSIAQLILIIALVNSFAGILSGNAEIVERLNSIAYATFLKIDPAIGFNTKFFIFDLVKKDVINIPFEVTLPMFNWQLTKLPGILVFAAATVQFFSAKMMLPRISSQQKAAKNSEGMSDDMAVAMQKQMIYLFPILYLWLGTRYPSGLALYFLTTSIFSLLRQLTSSGRLRVIKKL